MSEGLGYDMMIREHRDGSEQFFGDRPAPEIGPAVCLPDLAQDPAGVSHRDHICRQILRDDAARADDGVFLLFLCAIAHVVE